MILLVFGRRRRPQTLNPRNSRKLIIRRAEIFSGEVLAIYLSDELGLERLRDFATIHTCSLTLSVTVNFSTFEGMTLSLCCTERNGLNGDALFNSNSGFCSLMAVFRPGFPDQMSNFYEVKKFL